MPMDHIMIDNETLSTRPDAVILSIGAVKFDPYSDEVDNGGFYAVVSISSNLDAGRHISESTLQWWMQQSEGARKVFSEPSISLPDALNSLTEWIDGPNYKIWSNGASFDIPMIEHAYATHGADTPWKFWNANCFRTIKNLPACKNAVKVPNPLAHNALADALTQAKQLQEYFKVLKG